MNALSEQFVAEARELIAQATAELIGLERDGATVERLDRLLRAFHTLKGSAGLVDLPAMTLTMHAAEDLVTALRTRRLAVARQVITDALESLDLVSRWIDSFETQGDVPPRAVNDARVMADRLRAHLGSADAASAEPVMGEVPEWATRLVRIHHGRIHAGAACAIRYEPHTDCFFDGDDPLRLLRAIPDLLMLRVEGSAENQPLDDIDPFACRLRFHAIAAGRPEQLAPIFRNVPDQVRIVDLSSSLAQDTPGGAETGDARPVVRAVIAEQCAMLRAGAQDEGLAGRIGAASRSAANALRYSGLDALADEVAAGGTVAANDMDPAPLLRALERALARLTEPKAGEGAGAAWPAQAERSEEAAQRYLRVPEARIDALVNLTGELIVLKNSLAHLTRRQEIQQASGLSADLRRMSEAAERLASDFQDAVLGLRMVPVDQALRPLPRLVRDLSLQLGKKVQLVVSGEDTEFDKSVIDRLLEPLLHMVRNAIDHGIEPPEARIAANKGETGLLAVAVMRSGDRVVVELRDDGRGIDPEAIRRKAEEQGLIGSEALAALADEQVFDLIFSAGLSTAREISDVSGRGVGMDVVKRTIEQIGGGVSVTSRLGAGTTVRIDLPVSMATARIMVVECAGQRFGILMDAVTETVRVGLERIRKVKANEGFVLRDRVVPICSLAGLMGLPVTPGNKDEGRLLMVTGAGGETVAVEIDAISDRMEAVLKPMQGLLSSARGYAGTTILGDGSVLLVLNLRDILP